MDKALSNLLKQVRKTVNLKKKSYGSLNNLDKLQYALEEYDKSLEQNVYEESYFSLEQWESDHYEEEEGEEGEESKAYIIISGSEKPENYEELMDQWELICAESSKDLRKSRSGQ